jgi:replicative DNA helicase
MPHEIIGRLITLVSRVRYDAITKPKTVNKSEMQKIKIAVEAISNSRLWVDASHGQTLDSIASEAERIRDIEGSLSLIVVDYIQIVTGQRQRNETKEQEVARVSSGLKQLAKKMGCPVITGCQLNESGQTRDSRAIEQDSDTLLLIEEGGLLLKKVRNGERGGIINMALDGAAQRFRRFKQP